MPAPELSPPRRGDADATYYYRRRLRVSELLPAIGVAIGAGLVAFYITRLLLQRTPIRVERPVGRARVEGRAEGGVGGVLNRRERSADA